MYRLECHDNQFQISKTAKLFPTHLRFARYPSSTSCLKVAGRTYRSKETIATEEDEHKQEQKVGTTLVWDPHVSLNEEGLSISRDTNVESCCSDCEPRMSGVEL